MTAKPEQDRARMSMRSAATISPAIAAVCCSVALAVLGGCAGLGQPAHKTIVSFGDSLSDAGRLFADARANPSQYGLTPA